MFTFSKTSARKLSIPGAMAHAGFSQGRCFTSRCIMQAVMPRQPIQKVAEGASDRPSQISIVSCLAGPNCRESILLYNL